MAEKQIKARIKLKGDTLENWKKAEGFIPEKNEVLLVTDKNAIMLGDKVKTAKEMADAEDFFLAKAPIMAGEAQDSIISVSDEQNLGLSEYAIALGSYAVAGVKGYYYTSIDFENKQIYLSTTQATPPYIGAGVIDTNISLDYTIGNKIVVDDGNRRYFNEATITDIHDNVITYEGDLGFSSIASVSSPNKYCWMFFVINEYEKGQVSFGNNAVAIGRKVASLGVGSFAEGQQTIAGESSAHAEGELTLASGQGSHAEGNATIASGAYSHSEGILTKSTANGTHAEGIQTIASANGAHSEGNSTLASGKLSHAEGNKTIASGYASHAEGDSSIAEGDYSRAAGREAISIGYNSQAEGNNVFAGCRGYYWQAIDLENKEIYLCKEQTTPLITESTIKIIEELTNVDSYYTVTLNSAIQNPYLINVSGTRQYEYIENDMPYNVDINFTNGVFLLDVLMREDDLVWYRMGNVVSADFESQPPVDSYVTAETIESATVVYKDDTTYIDTSFTPDYVVGDEIAIVNNNKYFPGATISAIKNNVITYEGNIGFTVINEVDSENYDLDDYCIYVIAKPAPEQDVASENRICKVIKRDSHAEGRLSSAQGNAAHAEGTITVAYGDHAHAEGYGTRAAWAAHAEGSGTTASGFRSHAEGTDTISSGPSSHSEGTNTQSTNYHAHAEGLHTTASGLESHSEGKLTVASGEASHAEGNTTEASATGAHAEGYSTKAIGAYTHAEGGSTVANAARSHTEGYLTIAGEKADQSHAEGLKSETGGSGAHAEGVDGTYAVGRGSHAEGLGSQTEKSYVYVNSDVNKVEGQSIPTTSITIRPQAASQASHTEGYTTYATGEGAHSEGRNTYVNGRAAHGEGYNTSAMGAGSHSEGYDTRANGKGAHVEGNGTYTWNNVTYNGAAIGIAAHAEGNATQALGEGAHSEGRYTLAKGYNAHAEGCLSKAIANHTHAEGYDTTASGVRSHAEGDTTIASATGAHAEGQKTVASGAQSHAGGLGTKATATAQTAIGKYNAENNDALFIVGNGISDTDRKNAFEVYADGGHSKDVVVLSEFWELDSGFAGTIQELIKKTGEADIDSGAWSCFGNSVIEIGERLTKASRLGVDNILTHEWEVIDHYPEVPTFNKAYTLVFTNKYNFEQVNMSVHFHFELDDDIMQNIGWSEGITHICTIILHYENGTVIELEYLRRPGDDRTMRDVKTIRYISKDMATSCSYDTSGGGVGIEYIPPHDPTHIASVDKLGSVKIDDDTIKITEDGVISVAPEYLPSASSTNTAMIIDWYQDTPDGLRVSFDDVPLYDGNRPSEHFVVLCNAWKDYLTTGFDIHAVAGEYDTMYEMGEASRSIFVRKHEEYEWYPTFDQLILEKFESVEYGWRATLSVFGRTFIFEYLPGMSYCHVTIDGKVLALDYNNSLELFDSGLNVSSSKLPPVTTENNGQFLQVVNGAWAAVTVGQAEEVLF